jgi:hypothetical protein
MNETRDNDRGFTPRMSDERAALAKRIILETLPNSRAFYMYDDATAVEI